MDQGRIEGYMADPEALESSGLRISSHMKLQSELSIKGYALISRASTVAPELFFSLSYNLSCRVRLDDPVAAPGCTL